MKTEFRSKLIVEFLSRGKYVKLVEPFRYFSEILNMEVEIPIGFICDLESVPVVKATSNRGGVVHDYFCRKDSMPIVSKQKAASLYLEAQKCRDMAITSWFGKRWLMAFRRHVKCLVVRVAPGYFHKLSALATIEEVSGIRACGK